jgi:protease IV
MKYITGLLLFFLSFSGQLLSQPLIPAFHQHHDFLMTSSGAMKFGLYGYDNPALLTYLHQPDLYFTWTDQNGSFGDFNKWGLFAAIPNAGFGLIQQETPFGSVTDYRLSSAFGNRTMSAGFGFGWSGGDTELFNRERLLSIGLLLRPNRFISIGVVGYQTLRRKNQQIYTDFAVRPFGNEFITLFADFSMRNDQSLREGNWSAGAAIELLPGIRLTGRAFEGDMYTAGVSVDLGRAGVNMQRQFNSAGNGTYNTYGIRFGAYDRNIIDRYAQKNNTYLSLNLRGGLRYQQFRLFDSSNTLKDILQSIDEARRDPSVAGIAINMSDFRASHAMKWEVRERLIEFRAAGKKVIIYFDRGGITDYHFASVADRLVMDPQGMIMLEGFIMGNTYLKGLLSKAGIAVDEWRFFEYKSAFEPIAREEMSQADREQRQRLIDHSYELVRSDVTGSRDISDNEFDKLVDEIGIILPSHALEYGLVDTLGRWDEIREIIADMEDGRKRLVSRDNLSVRQQPIDNRWSEPPRIAVIYALGVCAMDEGITARKLVNDVHRARRDNRVKAIVFRVDSPGGDALASDLVSQALKKAMKDKPVIVTQGAVAASGGYWLSMNSDMILAAPNTITGSIGVIGGWLYDDGFKDKLGLTTDFVKRGAFADLGFGATLPLLNLQLPDRNLSPAEYEIMQSLLMSLYEDFVQMVADGRNMEYDEIEPISQGRVWSGYDGLDIGLVDEIGGLADAIRLAREKAGLSHDAEVEIVEYPEPGLFDASIFVPRLFGVEIKEKDPFIEYIIFRLRHNGQPLPMLPLEMTNPEDHHRK